MGFLIKSGKKRNGKTNSSPMHCRSAMVPKVNGVEESWFSSAIPVRLRVSATAFQRLGRCLISVVNLDTKER